MYIKQISIFIENTFGSAAEALSVLSEANIDIKALSVADTSDYGIMRLIVDAPQKAQELLQQNGIMVKTTDVLAVPISNVPGGLSYVLEQLVKAGVSIEYMYAFVGSKDGKAIVVAKPNMPENAVKALREVGIEPLCSSELF